MPAASYLNASGVSDAAGGDIVLTRSFGNAVLNSFNVAHGLANDCSRPGAWYFQGIEYTPDVLGFQNLANSGCSARSSRIGAPLQSLTHRNTAVAAVTL